MNTWRARILAAQVLLLFPLVLFLCAVVAGGVPALADTCARIVGWYVTRFWSLWVLLLALPMVAVLLGVVALSSARASVLAGARTTHRALLATTAAATVLLGVVILHMAAN